MFFHAILRRIPLLFLNAFTIAILAVPSVADEFKPVPLESQVDRVAPFTGIVLWTTNENVETAPIALEYQYLTYRDVTNPDGSYRWEKVDQILDAVASRGHQLVLRWHDTYVGKKTGVPAFITARNDYKVIKGKSEGKVTEFPDWSNEALQTFTLKFLDDFATRYDQDKRLAFVQIGFGLWAEYHIYDGPMQVGKTFPSKEFQKRFLQQASKSFTHTPWMISIDAANEEWSPLVVDKQMLELPFGLFDDSFSHEEHNEYNAECWRALGETRWQQAPAGGEFSYYDDHDQEQALAPKGPHGIPFEDQASQYHISFIIGDGQTEHQPSSRIKTAGMATGYRFEVTGYETDGKSTQVQITNKGVAPIYFDCYCTIASVRSETSLAGLLPSETREIIVNAAAHGQDLTIACDRLLEGQTIPFDAKLSLAK